MIIYQLLSAVFYVFFASLNAQWIADGLRVKHAINGLAFITIAVIAALVFHPICFFIILLNTRVVFDTALNLFRGVGLDYVSPDPKSIVDKIEKKLFQNSGLIPKILYLFLSIVLNHLYFKYLT